MAQRVENASTMAGATSSKTKGSSKNCFQSEKILRLDGFGTAMNLNFEGGNPTYRTATGAFMNVIILTVTLIFAVEQSLILLGYDATTFTQSEIQDYFPQDFSYDKDKGFRFAFKLLDITSQDGRDPDGIPIEEILELEFGQFATTVFADGTSTFSWDSFEIHDCSEEELSEFYPLKESQQLIQEQFQFLIKGMKCVDVDKISVMGDYQSINYISKPYLNVKIPDNLCRNDPYDYQCVTTREMDQKISEKTLITLQNQKRFDQLNYDDPVIKESLVQLYPIPSRTEVKSFTIQETQVEREDNLAIALNGITTLNDNFFEIKEIAVESRAQPLNDPTVRLQYVFRVSHDLIYIDRSVYNSLMLLGDVGGLSGLLYGVGSFIIGILNFQNPENFLVGKLYRPAEQVDQNDIFNRRRQFAIKELLQSLVPLCCLRLPCLKRSKRDREFSRAREKLSDEMDLVGLIRQLRVFKAVQKSLLMPAKLEQLRQDSQQEFVSDMHDPGGSPQVQVGDSALAINQISTLQQVPQTDVSQHLDNERRVINNRDFHLQKLSVRRRIGTDQEHVLTDQNLDRSTLTDV